MTERNGIAGRPFYKCVEGSLRYGRCSKFSRWKDDWDRVEEAKKRRAEAEWLLPEWLHRWHSLAQRLRRALWDLETTLASLTRLTCTPTTTQLTLRMVPSVLSAAASCLNMAPRNPVALPQTSAEAEECPHKNLLRFENQRGQYAKCETCGRQWRCDRGVPRWALWQPHSQPSSASGPQRSSASGSSVPHPTPKRQASTPPPSSAQSSSSAPLIDLTRSDLTDEEGDPWPVPPGSEGYIQHVVDAEEVFDDPWNTWAA